MIASADGAAVAGAFEIAFERRRRSSEPEPSQTVRLPVPERSILLAL